MDLIKVQYKGSLNINIPLLRSKGRGLELPLKDHFTGKVLPLDQQTLFITKDEYNCLVRCWGEESFIDLTAKKEEIKKDG